MPLRVGAVRDLHESGADERARDVDAHTERGQLRRPVGRVEIDPHARAVDADDAEVDAHPDVDLERQRIRARHPRGKDAEDLPERVDDGERAAALDVDRVAARRVEDGMQLERLAAGRVAVRGVDADRLVPDGQRLVGADRDDAEERARRRPRDGYVDEDVGLHLVRPGTEADVHLAAVPDDPLDLEERDRRDPERNQHGRRREPDVLDGRESALTRGARGGGVQR